MPAQRLPTVECFRSIPDVCCGAVDIARGCCDHSEKSRERSTWPLESNNANSRKWTIWWRLWWWWPHESWSRTKRGKFEFLRLIAHLRILMQAVAGTWYCELDTWKTTPLLRTYIKGIRTKVSATWVLSTRTYFRTFWNVFNLHNATAIFQPSAWFTWWGRAISPPSFQSISPVSLLLLPLVSKKYGGISLTLRAPTQMACLNVE